MVGTFKICIAAVTLLIGVSFAASADDDESLCGAYSAIGQVTARELLPVTIRDLVRMVRGENPKLLNRLSGSITDSMSGTELAAFSQLSEADANLAGEAAGATALGALLGGVSDDANEIARQMKIVCLQQGFEALMDNQRAANAAQSQNSLQ